MISQKTLNVYINVGIKYTYECQCFHTPFNVIRQKTLHNSKVLGELKKRHGVCRVVYDRLGEGSDVRQKTVMLWPVKRQTG